MSDTAKGGCRRGFGSLADEGKNEVRKKGRNGRINEIYSPRTQALQLRPTSRPEAFSTTQLQPRMQNASSLGLSGEYPILISTLLHLHALAKLDPTIVLPYPLSATRRDTVVTLVSSTHGVLLVYMIQ